MGSGQVRGGTSSTVALRCPHQVGPGLQDRSNCPGGYPASLCSPGPGTCAARPPIPLACAQQPSRPNQARVDSEMACNGQGSTDSVPGCRGAGLLIIQVSRWKDQPAPAGWLAGHWAPSSQSPMVQGSKVQGPPRLLSDVDLRILGPSQVEIPRKWARELFPRFAFAITSRQLQVHTSLLAPPRPVPSTLVPRTLYDGHDDFLALLPCSPRSLLTLDLPPLTPAPPPPSRPSHLPGVSHRHCHDFNLPLRLELLAPSVSLTHTSSTNDRPSSISPESPLHVTLPGPNFTHLCFAPVPCLSFFSYVLAT